MRVCRWKSKNNRAAVLKWLFFPIETVNKCVWLRMARMEIDSNLKASGRLFQVLALFKVHLPVCFRSGLKAREDRSSSLV